MLLYQAFFSCISISFVRLIFWKIWQEISFSDVNMTGFFQFFLKIERTALNPEFSTALLSFACGRHLNKCKYLIFANLTNISLWKRFLKNFAQNWKDRHFMVNGHRSLKLSRKGYIFMVTFGNWYFIAKIGTRNWYFSTIFVCF